MTPQEFFAQYPAFALGFSGGVDSAYLLYEALRHGAKVGVYYVKTPFQPRFELEDALRLGRELGVEVRVLKLSVLEDPRITANPSNRCYHCKGRIFGAIAAAAKADGFTVLADGTNASDDAADRPGMKALKELEVLSPLRMWGMTKARIREASRKAGLFTWDKPAYACLATRIPAGEEITPEKLAITEKSEEFLRNLGFRDFRVRYLHGGARLQLPAEQMERALELRPVIWKELKNDYTFVVLDLEARNEQ